MSEKIKKLIHLAVHHKALAVFGVILSLWMLAETFDRYEGIWIARVLQPITIRAAYNVTLDLTIHGKRQSINVYTYCPPSFSIFQSDVIMPRYNPGGNGASPRVITVPLDDGGLLYFRSVWCGGHVRSLQSPQGKWLDRLEIFIQRDRTKTSPIEFQYGPGGEFVEFHDIHLERVRPSFFDDFMNREYSPQICAYPSDTSMDPCPFGGIRMEKSSVTGESFAVANSNAYSLHAIFIDHEEWSKSDELRNFVGDENVSKELTLAAEPPYKNSKLLRHLHISQYDSRPFINTPALAMNESVARISSPMFNSDVFYRVWPGATFIVGDKQFLIEVPTQSPRNYYLKAIYDATTKQIMIVGYRMTTWLDSQVMRDVR